jgi:hypothetical protein
VFGSILHFFTFSLFPFYSVRASCVLPPYVPVFFQHINLFLLLFGVIAFRTLIRTLFNHLKPNGNNIY